MPTAHVVRPCERTKEELHAELEELAQRYLSMSADAFLEAAEAHRLPDTPAVRYMLVLSGVAAWNQARSATLLPDEHGRS